MRAAFRVSLQYQSKPVPRNWLPVRVRRNPSAVLKWRRLVGLSRPTHWRRCTSVVRWGCAPRPQRYNYYL